MSETENLFGQFSKCLWLLVKEHEPTKSVFEYIRNKWQFFINGLKEISKDTAEALHTGSSFDDLHMTRLKPGNDSIGQFYPPVDFDYMMIYKEYEVKDLTSVEDKMPSQTELSDIVKSSKYFAVMVPFENPGYVKLHITEYGRQMIDRPSCKIKEHILPSGNIPNFIFRADLFPEKYGPCEILYSRETTKYTESGPAISKMEDEKYGVSYDFVHAFPCKAWPGAAEQWKKRNRPNNWPERKLIEEIVNGGCDVVPIGHQLCTETQLQWRLSFNKAERVLSRNLTVDQRICYCIVKLMMKCQLPEDSALTSYHVKNMMFWFCEQYCRPEEWTSDRLGANIFQFVSYIVLALQNRNIPQYFMSRNNLISHKTTQKVDTALAEVLKIKEKPFESLTAVCNRLCVFEVVKGVEKLSEHQNELQSMLILYTTFVQTLYKLGLANLSTYLAPICFKYIVELNKGAQRFIKTGSTLFCANSIPALLKPLAISCMQTGSTDDALSLNTIMLETDRETVLKDYPDVITNIACLHTVKAESSEDKTEKKELCLKAKEYFDLALTCTSKSQSLHFAYGNFLLSNKISVKEALMHFRKAIAIENPREDDEALIQIHIPGQDDTNLQQIYVDGKVASYFILISCLCGIDETYEARTLCTKLEKTVKHAKLERRCMYMKLCQWCYAKAGLPIKASLLYQDVKKFAKFKTVLNKLPDRIFLM